MQPVRHAILPIVLLLLSHEAGIAQYLIQTYAGGGAVPFDGGLAVTLRFDPPYSVVPDGAGGFYFSTEGRIFRVGADGVLKISAGRESSGFSGDGGAASLASLSSPRGLARDRSGNLFIADESNHRVRMIDPAGIITTVAGNGTQGFSGDGGPALMAQLDSPYDVAVDGYRNLYVLDRGNSRVRKITPGGAISTVAGDGIPGFNGDGVPATAVHIDAEGIASDTMGNLFLAEPANLRVRKIAIGGVISTIAGTGGASGLAGDGGPATLAQLLNPRDVEVDASENVLIVDASRIRRIGTSGIITTVAGTTVLGFGPDSQLATTSLLHPIRVAADDAGNLFIADYGNQRIRRVGLDGIITTVAGTGASGFSGDNGPAAAALLELPGGIAMDTLGNLFIADTHNNRIRKVSPSGIISTFAGNGSKGGEGDGGPATSASLNMPSGVAVDPAGNVFIVDCSNGIRRVTPDGVIRTLASPFYWGFCGIGYWGPSTLTGGSGIAADAKGNLFVADRLTHRVRKITPAGEITSVAGSGVSGFSGDGGPATVARLALPWGIAVDADGNLYIADTGNYRIRKVTPDGIISTVAGNGTFGPTEDNILATSTGMQPIGVAVDADGNLLIVDAGASRIRKVTAGIITTVAGTGIFGFGGDGGPATSANLDTPMGVTTDANGDIYIADTNNHRIRRLIAVVPALASVSPNFGGPGATVNVVFSGTNLLDLPTINAGPDVTVTDVQVASQDLVTATFTIAPDAAPGVRNVTVTNGLGKSDSAAFNIGGPFPDLSVKASHGPLAIGFDGSLSATITNVGSLPTSGPIALTEILPDGLTFLSASGGEWSCSVLDKTVTCVEPQSLAPGDSTEVTLIVAVDEGAPAKVIHQPVVETEGDLGVPNNTDSDVATIAAPALSFSFPAGSIGPAKLGSVRLSISQAFQRDLEGTLRLSFNSTAKIPLDDPAIQFITGGRDIHFNIPANTQTVQFDGVEPVFPGFQADTVGFQPGTVAGTLTFTATLQSGAFQRVFSTNQTIATQPPVIKEVRLSAGVLAITTLSTPREITELILTFDTTFGVRLSCGAAPGCTVLGNTLILDVNSQFDSWYRRDSMFGSLSTAKLPLTIQGASQGTIAVSVRNSLGLSNPVNVPLP